MTAGQCTHGSIQAAVAAAEANPGSDVIRLTRSISYSAIAVQITSSQDIDIIGGFATCDQVATDSLKTTVSGTGGATEPVFRVVGATGNVIRLRHLAITGGDEDSGGYGGGIYFRGDGVLELLESNVSNNVAGYGGGVYAEGTGNAAELIIGNDVTIANNTARGSGGGIYSDDIETTMTAPGSVVAFNSALGTIGGGYGGGILVNAIDRDSYAYLGSNGQGSLGLVFGNDAVYGGGIAVIASNTDGAEADLHLFTTDVLQPTRVRDNFASVAGGGLYLRSDGVFFTGPGYAYARLWNVHVEENVAPDGAAIYLTTADEEGGFLFMNWLMPDGAVPCPSGVPCGRIAGNLAADAGGEPTEGSIIHAGSRSYLSVEKVAIVENRGGRLLRGTTASNMVHSIELTDTLVADNQSSLELIRMDGGDASLHVVDSTIGHNTIGGSHVIVAGGHVDVARSLIAQPGTTSLLLSGGTLSTADIVASEIESLGGGPEVIYATPRFVDPARGDYTLRAASAAVDFAPATDETDIDMLGGTRDVDLPIKAHFRGRRDVGAIERPALLPLVLNSDFNTDLNLWPLLTANSATWDAGQNASGGAGSGAIRVLLDDAPQTRVSSAHQCVHLPGPGPYALNGHGRSIGAAGVRDTVLLHWEYRINGGEACNAGPATTQGDHVLSSSSLWTSPAIPAFIDVPPAQFTSNSSITVSLVVIDNAISNDYTVHGWFDGITLAIAGSDVIFEDGFDTD